MTPAPPWFRRQLSRGARYLGRLTGSTGKGGARKAPASASALAGYSARVASGTTAPRAATEVARELLFARDLPGALALGHALASEPPTAQAGAAVLGLCHLHTSTPRQAWTRFATLDDSAVIAAAAPEYFEAGYVVDPVAADARARTLPDARQGDRPTAAAALRTAQTAFSVGYHDTAGLLLAAGRRQAFGTLTENQAYQYERLATWLPDGSRRRPIELPPADLRFGVLDYKQPDNSSRNVGDFIQTLASLGHLVRHDNLRFVGDPDLVGFVDGLRSHVKPERRLDDTAAQVHLVEVQRDGNVYQDLPEPTWAVMFGWYLHPTFAGGYNLPFHPALRPLFISFHLNKPEALTPAAVEYLRRYGPIGCRDWQTVAMLTGAGVPAFFSGCITTTVDTVFARSGPDTRTETGYIDAREGSEDADNIEQSVGDIRRSPLPENLALAREWVGRYHEQYRRVVTSRLHSYLPARSVGCEVEFGPANRSDPRFGGLIDIDDAAFEAIRRGILDTLARMIDLLAAGADEDTAYARWRELTAPSVEAARAFLDAARLPVSPLPGLAVPLPDADRVVVIDAPRQTAALGRLVSALDRHAAGIPVVAVGAGAAKLPAHVVAVTELPLVERGSEIARHNLLVADVLASLPAEARVLVLPSDALVRADLEPLFAADLGTEPIAARPDIRRNRQNRDALLRRISARQGPDWEGALRFLAATHGRAPHDAELFDPRVAVIRPGALADAGWADLARGLVETYGATWVEALNVVAGGRFRPLPESLVGNVALEDVEGSAPVLIGLAQSRLPADRFPLA